MAQNTSIQHMLPCAIDHFKKEDVDTGWYFYPGTPMSSAMHYLTRYVYVEKEQVTHTRYDRAQIGTEPWGISKHAQLHKLYSNVPLRDVHVVIAGCRLKFSLLGVSYVDGVYTFKYPLTLLGAQWTNYTCLFFDMNGVEITTPRLELQMCCHTELPTYCEVVHAKSPITCHIPVPGKSVRLDVCRNKIVGFMIESSEDNAHLTSLKLEWGGKEWPTKLFPMTKTLIYMSLNQHPFFMNTSTLVNWTTLPNFSTITCPEIHVNTTKEMMLYIHPWTLSIIYEQNGCVGIKFNSW